MRDRAVGGSGGCANNYTIASLTVHSTCVFFCKEGKMRSHPSGIIVSALSRCIDRHILSLRRDTKVQQYETITTKRLTTCAQFLSDRTQRHLVRLKVESMVDKLFRRHKPTRLYHAIVVWHNDTHAERRSSNLETAHSSPIYEWFNRKTRYIQFVSSKKRMLLLHAAMC